MSGHQQRRPWIVALVVSLLGALVATVLGFLTFGAQATAQPDHIPVAVSVPEGSPLRAVAEQVATRGGGQLDWRVADPAQARKALADKEVYGILELGGPAVNVVVSGAVNPSGTQVAQQALTGAGQAMSAALAQRTGATPAPVAVEQIHRASGAGRTAPLALSALAWVGCLAAAAAMTLLLGRAGATAGIGSRLLQVLGSAVLMTAVLAGFLRLWNAALPITGQVVGFLGLVALAFASVQAGALRLLGIRAMAVLGPLYLVAPAVAGQVPELLDPAYRAALWSWTPFRFSTEGLRSLLQGTPDAPDVSTAIWVLLGMLAVGLLLVLVPGKRKSAGKKAEPDTPDGVVHVGVH